MVAFPALEVLGHVHCGLSLLAHFIEFHDAALSYHYARVSLTKRNKANITTHWVLSFLAKLFLAASLALSYDLAPLYTFQNPLRGSFKFWPCAP